MGISSPRPSTYAVALCVAAIACGSDESTGSQAPPAPEPEAARNAATAATATRITVRGSDYGRMLWGPGRQAIYIFERDRPQRSRCYGECARAWPPVLTRGRPVAGRGVRKALLGTTRRRDGKRQVTYDGQPLYYYAHEGAGEVRCHNVVLNGGFWWVVGPDGKRRP